MHLRDLATDKILSLKPMQPVEPLNIFLFFPTNSFSAGESNNMICFLVQSQTCRSFLVTWRHQKPENVAFSEGFEAADIHTASAHAFCSLHSQALPTRPPPMHFPCACYCTSILSFKRQCSRSSRLCSSSRTACLLHLMQAKIPGLYPLCHHGPNNDGFLANPVSTTASITPDLPLGCCAWAVAVSSPSLKKTIFRR